ncbi:MAG: ethanolamine ammonia-lyase subunit EutC [Gammaproteobacteria bacterium]
MSAKDERGGGRSLPVVRDPWERLRALTPARIALGRAGAALPTDAVLAFDLAQAQARDAVHAALDVPRLVAELADDGWASALVRSQAVDRATYLRRPDLGRRLDEAARAQLMPTAGGCELAFVIGDGLSALAVQRHAVALLHATRPLLDPAWRIAPVCVATQARVALGDEIGAALAARLVAVLIGERPGLSSPDSLGVYLTYDPRPGRSDAERNCLSNIRPAGLDVATAARKLAWHLHEALRRKLTGVDLKDESERRLSGPEDPTAERQPEERE